MVKYLRIVSVLTLVLIFSFTGLAFADEGKSPYKVGDKVMSLVAKDSSGSIVDIVKSSGGKKGLIVFMNTACSACRTEVKYVMSVAKQYADKVNVFVVSVDFGDFARIKAYQVNNKFDQGIWLQDEGFNLPPVFNFSYTPALVLLDSDGTVLYKFGGYSKLAAKKIEADVEALLK